MNEKTQLDVVLRLKDELSGKLNTINSSMGRVGDRFSREWSLISKAAKIATGVIVGGTAAIGAFAIKAGFASARISELEFVLGAVAKANGLEIEKAQETVKELREFNIAHKQALEITNLFMQSQLDLDDAIRLGNAAKDLAVIGAMDSSEATKVLIEATASQSNMALRQFGIIKNLDDIYDEYGLTINKTGRDLTETEKKQAFLNTIFEQGEKVAGTYDAAMESVSKRYRSLTGRIIPDFIAQVGKAFEPSMIIIIDRISESIKTMSGWVSNNEEIFKQWGEVLAGKISEVIGKIEDWVESIGGTEGIKIKLLEMWDTIKNEVIPVIKKLILVVQSIIKFIWEHKEAIAVAILVWEAFKIAISIWETYSSVKLAITGITKVVAGSGGLTASMKGLAGFIFSPAGLVAALAAVALVITTKAIKAFEDMQVWIDQYNETTEISKERVKGFKEHIKKLPEGEYKEKMEVMVEENEKMIKEVDEMVKRYEGWKGAIFAVWDTMAEFYRDMKGKLLKLLGYQNDLDKGAGGGGGGSWSNGGIIPLATGGLVHASGGYFEPRGTDTVPAMLTPGEMVLNKRQQSNLFSQLNGGGGRITININGEQHYYNDQSVDNLVNKIRDALSRDQEKAEWGIA